MGWFLAALFGVPAGAAIINSLRKFGPQDLAGSDTRALPPIGDPTSPATAPPEVVANLAQTVVGDILANGARFDPNNVRAFQRAAGLAGSGKLDAATAMALAQYGHDILIQIAHIVVDDVNQNGAMYNHEMVALFQALVQIRPVTGVYDHTTADRMAAYFPSVPPPPPQQSQYTPQSPYAGPQSGQHAPQPQSPLEQAQQGAQQAQQGAQQVSDTISSALHGTGGVPNDVAAQITQSELAWAVRKSRDPMAKRKFTALFQRGEGLPMHGKLDPRTVAALERY